jgi:hypothetical protein
MADPNDLRAMAADMRRRDAYKRRTGGEIRIVPCGFEVEVIPDHLRGDKLFFYEEQARYYAEISAAKPEMELWRDRAELYRRVADEEARARASKTVGTARQGEGGPSHESFEARSHHQPRQPERPPRAGSAPAEADPSAEVGPAGQPGRQQAPAGREDRRLRRTFR